MKNKKEEQENIIKELLKTPRGKAILFFGAYLIFFLIIAIMARVGGTSPLTKHYENGSDRQFDLSSVTNNNYSFDFQINLNGVNYSYVGTRTRSSELFKVNDTEYYSNNNTYFMNKDGIWINTKTPYLLPDFIDSKNISKMIESAYFVSKTEFENKETIYNFKISSASINKLIGGKDLDVYEIPNEIFIGTDSNKKVNQVKYVFDSYCQANGLCENLTITLKYSLYGEIEEITSPLE